MKIIIVLLIFLFSINLQAQKKWIKKGEYTWENDFGEIINSNLNEITCVNDTLCFIQADVNLDYVLFESRDAGNTWDEVFVQSLYFGEYFLSTPNRGTSTNEDQHYFLTYDGLLLKTKDKGQSLDLLKFDEKDEILNLRTLKIDMLNQDIGFVMNIIDYIWLTYDGWDTFERIHLDDKFVIGLDIFYYNDTTLMFSGGNFPGEDRSLYKYHIKSDSLELVHTFVFGDEFIKGQNIFALDFTDQMNGNAIGGYNTGDGDKVMDLVYKTSDGGYSWKLVFEQVGNPPFNFNQLKFRDENYGIAVGGWGKFLLTEDGGDTWDYMKPPDEDFLSLFMRIDYAGDYPIVTADNEIYRLENITGLDEYIAEGANINIRQTNTKLLISIEDENFRQYELQIVNIQGNIVQESNLSSGVGTFFKPYDISNLGSGVFFYRIITEGLNVRTGNFIINN